MSQVDRVRMPDDGTARTLPWSSDAEQSVLGGILLHGRVLPEVSGVATEADFFHPAHVAIFAAMVALDAAGRPVDSVTVAEQMRTDDTFHRLRALNGESYFAELTSAVVTVENIAFHARIVHGKALVRRLIASAHQIAATGYGDYGDAEEYIADAERQVSAIAMDAAGGQADYKPIRNVLRQAARTVEARYDRKQAVTGVPWGFEALDAITGGMQPGQLIVLGGRPKQGKTALVMNAVERALLGQNANGTRHPVLVISLEMTDEELVLRMTSARGGVEGQRLRTGYLEQGDWIRFSRAAGEIAESRLHIFDGTATFSRIRSMARRWRARETEPTEDALLVVDYLQLIASAERGKNWNREQEVAGWTRGFKLLAKELRIPIALLCQLNRGVEQRSDKRPVMSDLRESGAIEQDADLVLLAYRDEVYNADSPMKGIAEVIIGAGRHVPTGTVHLRFAGEYTRFSDCTAGDVPSPSKPARRGYRGNGYTRTPSEEEA